MLLCVLEAVEGALCLLEALEVSEAMRCVLLCMLEAVEGGLCLLKVPEVMRRVLLCMLEAMRCTLLCRYAGGFVCWFRNFHCCNFLVTVRHLLIKPVMISIGVCALPKRSLGGRWIEMVRGFDSFCNDDLREAWVGQGDWIPDEKEGVIGDIARFQKFRV